MTTLLNIKIHETYNHKYDGKVKVTKIDRNTQEAADGKCGAYMVTYIDEYGIIDSQCINDFKMAVS